ncbi:hypothetical protein OPV22_032181 [Ensete ventricosum]|uniref:Uncharacterized protein n=1 Tax=Ensete ventricosum TaxID=4639 RepID=A0AAV8PWP4_ENSVE|nr:hypothetical protein OPV22_032181 [Ensete ventricosum]
MLSSSAIVVSLPECTACGNNYIIPNGGKSTDGERNPQLGVTFTILNPKLNLIDGERTSRPAIYTDRIVPPSVRTRPLRVPSIASSSPNPTNPSFFADSLIPLLPYFRSHLPPPEPTSISRDREDTARSLIYMAVSYGFHQLDGRLSLQFLSHKILTK